MVLRFALFYGLRLAAHDHSSAWPRRRASRRCWAVRRLPEMLHLDDAELWSSGPLPAPGTTTWPRTCPGPRAEIARRSRMPSASPAPSCTSRAGAGRWRHRHRPGPFGAGQQPPVPGVPRGGRPVRQAVGRVGGRSSPVRRPPSTRARTRLFTPASPWVPGRERRARRTVGGPPPHSFYRSFPGLGLHWVRGDGPSTSTSRVMPGASCSPFCSDRRPAFLHAAAEPRADHRCGVGRQCAPPLPLPPAQPGHLQHRGQIGGIGGVALQWILGWP